MDKHAMHNIVVKAEVMDAAPGFDIMLIFSGAPEFVLHHAHDGMLYKLLRNGMRLDDFRRWRMRPIWGTSAWSSRRSSRQLERTVNRLLASIDRYLAVRTSVVSSRRIVADFHA